MRTFLIGIYSALVIAVPASAGTRNFGLEDFTKIRVEGPFRVRLTTGVAPFARASGSATALDRIAIEVRGDTLIIEADRSAWGGYPGENAGSVEISVGTHDLTNAALTGAGSLAINHVQGLSFAFSVQGSGAAEIADVAVDDMQVTVAGTANVRLKGHSRKFTALVRGLSSLDAVSLVAPQARITADGAATIDASVTDAARVDASGPATIRLTGGPSCTLNVAGSTSVSGCK